ncbi:hypothetical protein [Nostoc sp. MS1]|uniref:hypothetical protein n=1 Tax=Nostoc sp. MS1 TaxID=2764711 RepID=UPI001CC613B2|nr:hypothetical protein [Nostoc sp. MS1]
MGYNRDTDTVGETLLNMKTPILPRNRGRYSVDTVGDFAQRLSRAGGLRNKAIE